MMTVVGRTRRRGGPGGDASSAAGWVLNRLWLVIPAFAFDAALTGRLPALYQARLFWADIPAWMIVAENSLRVVVIALPVLMPLLPLRPGTVITYAAGLIAYSAAWLMQIAAPNSPWSMSAIGSTAPAWSSALWLIGIGLGSRLRLLPWFRPWMYVLLVTVFVAVHTAHAWLVWGRAN